MLLDSNCRKHILTREVPAPDRRPQRDLPRERERETERDRERD